MVYVYTHVFFFLVEDVLQNEVEVGKAIRESGVPRKDIWITSKVSFRFLQ